MNLTISEAATIYLNKVITAEKKFEEEVLYVRLAMGIGWGSPQLKLSLEERPLKDDFQLVVKDIVFLINDHDKAYFNNRILDYIGDPLGQKKFLLRQHWLFKIEQGALPCS